MNSRSDHSKISVGAIGTVGTHEMPWDISVEGSQKKFFKLSIDPWTEKHGGKKRSVTGLLSTLILGDQCPDHTGCKDLFYFEIHRVEP